MKSLCGNIFKLSLIILINLIILSCGLFVNLNKPVQIVINSDTFTIAWDAGDFEETTDHFTEEYNLYYRTHGTTEWTLLLSIAPEENPNALISNNMLDYGVYDFAVSRVDNEKNESELHASLDDDAIPSTGWFVNWMGSRWK